MAAPGSNEVAADVPDAADAADESELAEESDRVASPTEASPTSVDLEEDPGSDESDVDKLRSREESTDTAVSCVELLEADVASVEFEVVVSVLALDVVVSPAVSNVVVASVEVRGVADDVLVASTELGALLAP
ncbi:hypothetical protein PHYBOEH_004862 [Phytophthora boehmeriae]|uniref:Uncharacterized protein n=1 Tax=Phytophthora boehmeriae TaxID=109152 RepID=A0A8T1WQ52_9STRA|nr:hypothetical protein PHYBOEH_004862 [Phytophthora boehmeriae]